ncbi:MAG: fibronectin type III domain-containing protein [Faecalibacterium sp.]|nr:fibronectin type III domain-containing protein [Ruminococcus sp.]MCM1391958.1 fibronectin type III domain-containing protein [Ruminococcus sp.]MCM1485083.1 fibronectin type III domain-containing protein [Faecalibacterium sp.]
MKKTAKALVTLFFCLSILCATLVPAFAASVGQVKNLKVTNITYNSAKLTWSKISSASKYVIERQNGKNWKEVATVKKDVTSYTVSKLTTGTTYKYRVYAKNVWGQKGSASSTVSVKPMPVKVTGLKAATITNNSIKLTWTKVAGATGYQVQKYDASKKKWVKLAIVKTNSYTASKLKINTTYKYRVAAYRTVSKKDLYGAYSATLSAKTALGKVTGVKASVVSPTSIKLTWSKVTNATGYYVERYDSSSKKWVSVKKDIKATNYTISKLTPNTTYKYRVKAYVVISKKTYTGAESSAVSVKPALGQVANVKAAIASGTSVKLTWNKLANANGYYVQQLNGKDWKNVKTITANGTVTYTVPNLTPNTTYKFRVVGYITVNKTAYKGTASAEVSASLKIATPSAVKLDGSATYNTLKFTWGTVKNVNGYRFEYYKDGKWVTKDLTTNSITVTGLAPNTSYQARVRAFVNSNAGTKYSAYTATLTTKTSALAVPSGFEASSTSNNSISLKWNKSANASGYEVQQNVNGSWKSLGTTTNTTYSVSGLAASTAYKFKVRAFVTIDNKPYYSNFTAEKNIATVNPLENISTRSITDNSLYLSWYPVKGITGYNIYVYNTVSKQYEPIKTVQQTDADYSIEAMISNLTPSNAYKYVVEPYIESADGTRAVGAKSEPVDVSTKPQYYTTTVPTINNSLYYYLTRTDTPRTIAYSRTTTISFQIKDPNDATANAETVNDSKVTVSLSGNTVKVSWTAVQGATKYIVQSRTNGNKGNWVDEIKTNSTSATLYLAPNTSFEIRVLTCDDKYQVYGYTGNNSQDNIYTERVTVKELPISTSAVKTIKTNAAPKFDTSKNDSMTLYTLMLTQAINNTKAEQSKVKLDSSYNMQAKIDGFTFNGKEYKTFKLLLKAISFIFGIDLDLDDEEMLEDMNESSKFSGTFTNGMCSSINDKNNYVVDYLNKAITPEANSAYLYNAYDVNNFSKKVKSISYKENSNGTKTITITLPTESVKNASGSTPVHDGLAQGATGIISSFSGGGLEINNITVGETTITAVINKNYTLDSLKMNSNLKMGAEYSGALDDKSVSFGANMSCTIDSDCKFTR